MGGTPETCGGALKKALASANHPGIQTVLILGDNELDGGAVTVKHMATGAQETCPPGRSAGAAGCSVTPPGQPAQWRLEA